MIDYALQLIFVLLARLVVLIRPLVPAVCMVLAWGTLALAAWTLVAAVRSALDNVRQMHQIPCARCCYATRDYRLKCSVRPVEAFSEQAIGCQDFEPAGSYPYPASLPSSEPVSYR
ncbi:MAG: hypothetical protein ACR2FS_20075 [Phormidesmis sp.]